MLKKMWALLIHHGEQIEVERASIFKSNVTSVDVGFEGKKEIKPITITDEDLFKNVRKLMDDNLDYNYNPVDLESAILKDIANFDNLPASGESLTGELGIVKTKKERL